MKNIAPWYPNTLVKFQRSFENEYFTQGELSKQQFHYGTTRSIKHPTPPLGGNSFDDTLTVHCFYSRREKKD